MSTRLPLKLVISLLLLGLAAGSGTYVSLAQSKLVQAVTERQSVMFEMQTAYWPLFEINKGSSSDLNAAVKSAGEIPRLIDKFVPLLLPGTAKGEVPGSRAKPEIWDKPEVFQQAVNDLKASMEGLSQAASTGDIDRYRSQFQEATKACTACHGLRGSSGGMFRFEK